jgi:hypothetical protein
MITIHKKATISGLIAILVNLPRSCAFLFSLALNSSFVISSAIKITTPIAPNTAAWLAAITVEVVVEAVVVAVAVVIVVIIFFPLYHILDRGYIKAFR